MAVIPAFALLVVLMDVSSAGGQTPLGTLSGVVTDASDGKLRDVRVTVVHAATGQVRTTTSSDDGSYSLAALPPGTYRLTAEVVGFRRLERQVTVEVGSTTAGHLELEVGALNDVVTVHAGMSRLRSHHQVAGVIGRDQIENLPVNGRNFVELARLEPGVTSPVRAAFGRMFVPTLGAGLNTIPRVGYTRTAIDGGNIVTVGAVGIGLQVSQEVVHEFQMSTVNIDPSTGATTNGAINIVTRSGGNTPHGGGFFFYRDHNLAAYPGLGRDRRNPDPFFQRRQFGGSMGGPIRRDSAFFFASYEQNDQRSIVSVQPNAPEFSGVGGLFESPYVSHLVSARGDVRVNPSHNLFGRFTYDGNHGFAPGGPQQTLPSAWLVSDGRVHQSLAGLTSVLTARLVNDLRLSYFSMNTLQSPPGRGECPDCFGLGSERITVANLTFGRLPTVDASGRRSQLNSTMTWQRGNHGLRVGFDWEHGRARLAMSPATQITLWSPADVRRFDPTIPLPAAFTVERDFLELPLNTFSARVGPDTVPGRRFKPHRVLDVYRVFVSDTWHARPRLTISAGLGWSLEPNALNHDLSKPALLLPILGSDGLRPPRPQYRAFSPTTGFTWTAQNGKTILRAGAGRYFDPAGSSNATNLANERVLLSPLGSGPIMVGPQHIVHDGRTLDFSQRPTTFTGAHLLDLLPQKLVAFSDRFDPGNRDFSVRTLDFTKSGSNLYDPSYDLPYAIHVNLGFQRELGGGVVIGADGVWKRFVHTFINGIDYNRWSSLSGPVIPPCRVEQEADLAARCSTGSMWFDTTIGRARYRGLLVRIEKRLSRRHQFLASYALGSYVGANGTGTGTAEASGNRVFGFNNDDWFENYGPLPTDLRHVMNLSGSVQLPWRFQLSFNISAYSKPPFSASVRGMDFNGDGTSNDLLPGSRVNQFGRSLDRGDLVRLVARYNDQYAGRRFGSANREAPVVTLPDDYSFDDTFFVQDVRITRSIDLRAHGLRLVLFGEVFNVLNTPNLVGYGADLTNRNTFGQPSARFTQTFGSGGPRACQLAARLTF